MAQAGARRLSGAETAVVVLSSLLILAFLVLLGVRFAGGEPDGGEEAATPEPGATATAPVESEEPAGEDLSDVRFDFASPTGNIACAVDEERALCGIAAFDYADRIPQPEVDACDGTVGHFLQVTAEGASLVCDTSGQTLAIDADDLPVLEYGETQSADGFTCASSESGMSCTHNDTGYTFAVRRAGYTLS